LTNNPIGLQLFHPEATGGIFFLETTLATLQLNPTKDEPIALDKGCEAWLTVIHNNSKKQRPCSVPTQYFDVLKTWGLVDGKPGNASLTPHGLAHIIGEEAAAKQTKKTTKTKKK